MNLRFRRRVVGHFLVVALAYGQLSACVQINTQPSAVTVSAGQKASFSVAAKTSTSGSISYQWYRNGAAINGATAATYSFTTSPADNGAQFYVIVNDSDNKPVTSNSVTLTVNLAQGYVGVLAGSGSPGYADGTGSAASFRNPNGTAVDAAGNVYVGDAGNNVVRKISPAGVVSTFAGTAGNSGSNDGQSTAARFNSPRAVATDAAGNVYVGDWGNETIRKISPTGLVTTLAGSPGVLGTADGTGAAASFSFINGLATDNAGDVFVLDDSRIRKITPAGVVSTIVPASAGLSQPTGITVDASGNLFVADSGNNVIRSVTPAGVVTTFVGAIGAPGYTDGTGTAASFNLPNGVVEDASGNLYVTDSGNYLIRKVTPAGVVSTVAGTYHYAGVTVGALPGGIGSAAGVAIDSKGALYVANNGGNAGSNVVVKIQFPQ